MAEWTQREIVPKRRSTRVKSSCTCVGLDPRDRLTNSFDLSERDGSDVAAISVATFKEQLDLAFPP